MTLFFSRNRGSFIALALVVVLIVYMLNRFGGPDTATGIISALTLGAVFFLVASGLSLIFGLMDVLNFAHGLFFMLGAYLGYTMYANPRMILNTLPLALAMLGGVPVGVWLAGLFGGVHVSSRANRIISFGLG